MSSTVTTPPSSAGSDSACPAQRPAVPASVTEERKRKRKESNRLSAQRSRARKQRQLDDLTKQLASLRAQNGAMAAAVHDATRQCAAVQAENELLRARYLELGVRLQSLLELIQYMDAATSAVYNPSPFAGAMHLQPPLLDATMYHYC
ncbi:hypothetical protein PR202_gb05881 [Eleusine coracana subsp. coracana]|uniref:BZIP domain-containing protein n=1 Tax=Eleusine coracana subsp. coracana TaxID=191504 RepID=A0AAV5E7G4_ELECO|nr:hypothetical protein PR202_gb05881 [Eleusine coracana subsp. coracana]